MEQLTETSLIGNPDVAVARAGVIKYMNGMAAHEAKPLFEYHPAFKFGGGDASLEFVEAVCIRIGVDGMPPENPLLEQPIQIMDRPSETERLLSWLCHAWSMQLHPDVPMVPEIANARDMVTLYKLMAEYDPGQTLIAHKQWHTLHATANWRPPEALNGSSVIAARVGLFGSDFFSEMMTPKTGNMTNPARFLDSDSKSSGRINEDDVLHSPTLHNFDSNLTQEDAEAFISALTVPYMRIPLVASFLADDRLGCLFNAEIQHLLLRVLFEPLAYFDAAPHVAEGKVIVEAVPIEPKKRLLLGTPYGLLVNEILNAPAGVVEPLLELSYRVVSMCVGDYDTSFVPLLEFVVRIMCRVEGVLVFVLESGRLPVEEYRRAELERVLGRLRVFTLGPARRELLRYIVQAEAARAVSAATRFHAHHALLYGNHRLQELTEEAVSSLLSSSSYVLAWHCQGEAGKQDASESFEDFDDYAAYAAGRMRQARGGAKADVTDGTTPNIPLDDVVEAVQRQRVNIMTWVERAAGEELDTMLSKVAGASRSCCCVP